MGEATGDVQRAAIRSRGTRAEAAVARSCLPLRQGAMHLKSHLFLCLGPVPAVALLLFVHLLLDMYVMSLIGSASCQERHTERGP
jgi:hypothetical protein